LRRVADVSIDDKDRRYFGHFRCGG
jgi:hypothetical protein